VSLGKSRPKIMYWQSF